MRSIDWMGADFGLHPLIHTLPPKIVAQSIVALSQEEKCGLKYVIRISGASLDFSYSHLDSAIVFP